MTKTADLFNQMDEKYGDTQADTGAGWLGTWPPAGDHTCEILRLEVNDTEKFIESNDSGMRTEHQATSYRFHFLLPENPEDGQPLEWGGAPFTFPTDLSKIVESGALKQIEINRNRLAGHLKTLLGVPVGNTDDGAIDMGTALDKSLAIINDGEQKLIVETRCQFKEYTSKRGRKGTNRTEFLLNLLS